MYIPFLYLFTNNHHPDEHPPVVAHEPQSISVEGGEFLDDALRMEDLPPHTEEIVATGALQNLL